MTLTASHLPALFRDRSCNEKLSNVKRFRHPKGYNVMVAQQPFVATTYTSIKLTCPSSCRFKDNGCYIQAGPSSLFANRLDMHDQFTGTEVNEIEAELIDQAWVRGVPQEGARGGIDIRIHSGGDFRSARGARAVGGALDRFKSRRGGDGWGYTHRWRTIPADSYGPAMSILASVETLPEVEQAIELGYTPAMTMRFFYHKTAYRLPGLESVKVIPCPEQTRGIKCNKCRLCMKKLPKGTAIGFELHGTGASQAAHRLPIIGQETFGW